MSIPKVKNKKIVWVVLGVLVCLSVVAWVVVWELDKGGDLEVVFFDVGQGDSIFIETKDGFQVLIDGGPGLAVLEKLGQETPFYDRTIDLVILTHPDRDHLFGLLEALKRYQVKNILWNGVVKDTAEWKEWNRLVQEEGAKILIAEAGQKIDISQDIYIEILYPFESLEGLEVKDSNDTSIVAQLVFKDNSFLFTGDISRKIEKKLVDEYQEFSSLILKIAHHGSKTSTSLEFLEMVSPETAVISVGDNQWGHPHPEVLSILEQFGIQVLTTQDYGDVKFIF
jgi:competence protein ComEC